MAPCDACVSRCPGNACPSIERATGFTSARRRSPRGGAARWALPLVAALSVCGPIPTAFGTEARTLVGNVGQPVASGASPVLAIQSLGMQFSTGESTSPWTLTSIQLDIGAWESGATPTVSLHAASGQSPGAKIATLANPSAGTGLKGFTVPTGTTVTLQSSTTYTVVVESDTTYLNYSGFTVLNTESAAEDSGAAAGWRISDSRLSNLGSGWSASSGNLRLRMAVLGTGGVVSDDATLSTLTLADDGGEVISLAPAFAAGTTSYTASVAHSASTATVNAATTHASATVSIANDDDTSTPGTAVRALGVGSNTVTVTVTAEDGTTTKTYTVAVTRAAAPPPGATPGPRTLVGNTGQPAAAGAAPVLSLQSLAMQFTTGDSARRWTLTSIGLDVSRWQSGVTPTVSLHTASGQNPGAKIATLTNPARGSGVQSFTAPSGSVVKLQASTTYMVVVEVASLVLNGFTLGRTSSTAEDVGGAAGWRIADTGLSNLGQGWSAGNHRLKLAVVGTADSADATLSTLTLADDSGNSISLDPSFEADTMGYAASVAHSLSTVTVTAAATDTNATLSIANDDDTGSPGTAELDLEVGENAVAVTVTAQDAATTSTYTLTVTRAAAAPAPDPLQDAQTLVGNIARPQHGAAEVHKDRRRVGIKFTTGDSATAWTLAAIRLQVTAWHASVSPTVRLRRMSGRWPGTVIATLTNPSPGTGSKEFAAPAGLKLQPNTTYGVVVAAGTRRGRFDLAVTKSNHEDGDGAAGWSIANASRSYASGSWSGLPQSLMIAVQGAATSDGTTSGGLTGWFASSPAQHDGSGEFTVRIGFSDPVRISRESMRSHAVQISGGRVRTAKRVSGSGDLWDLKIAPTALDAVTVTVEGGRACGSTGAVCTSDGNALAETLALSVPGPLALSVADAEAREGTDSAVVFAVTMSRAAPRAVTVGYATSDGTATAGEDYTATSGTLTFAAGVAEQSVSVPVLDDATNEGEESFTFTLSNASGALIDDGVATGTIVNSDPMPKAWITRFGRTVAAQAVSAITERLEGSGSGIVVGGIPIDSAASVPNRNDEHALYRHGGLAHEDPPRHALEGRSISPRALLTGSAFRFDGESAGGSPVWTTWGRVASSGFAATEDDVRLDGDVTTAFLGADVSIRRWLAGAAVSLSEGDGGFELVDAGRSEDKGAIESRLTSLFPYVRYSLSEQIDVWSLVGYGTGDLTLTERADEDRPRDVAFETDISMRMGAIGATGKVLSPDASGGVEVVVRSDAFWVRMESEAVRSEHSGRMEASTGEASRVRLLLEGSRALELASGGTLTPSAVVGIRHDGGNAETGAGIELGTGVRFAHRGLSVEGAVRTLVAHEESDYEEWGASGSIRIDPGASGEGLSLAVTPAWGAASSGVERLWSLADARELAPSDAFDNQRRLGAEIGYGLGLSAPGNVVTPYAGLSFVDGGRRSYRAGVRWSIRPDTALRLETAHEIGDGDQAPSRYLGLRAQTRW